MSPVHAPIEGIRTEHKPNASQMAYARCHPKTLEPQTSRAAVSAPPSKVCGMATSRGAWGQAGQPTTQHRLTFRLWSGRFFKNKVTPKDHSLTLLRDGTQQAGMKKHARPSKWVVRRRGGGLWV